MNPEDVIGFWRDVVTLFVAITVHEGGHLAAGLFLGFPIISMVVGAGPFLFSFRWHGVWFHWRALPVIGVVKTNWLSRRKWKNVSFYAAGPAANIVFGLIAFGVSDHLAWVSIALGLLNLLPSTFWGVASDGRQILNLIRRKPLCRAKQS